MNPKTSEDFYKPVIVDAQAEYFFSPTCEGCENRDYVIDFLGNHFTKVTARCVASKKNESMDKMICWSQYGINAEGSTNKLLNYGVDEVPAIFINRKFMSFEDVCSSLGYDKRCLFK